MFSKITHKKNPVLYDKVGNKLNKNKGFRHFIVTFIKYCSYLCPQILSGSDTLLCVYLWLVSVTAYVDYG